MRDRKLLSEKLAEWKRRVQMQALRSEIKVGDFLGREGSFFLQRGKGERERSLLVRRTHHHDQPKPCHGASSTRGNVHVALGGSGESVGSSRSQFGRLRQAHHRPGRLSRSVHNQHKSVRNVAGRLLTSPRCGERYLYCSCWLHLDELTPITVGENSRSITMGLASLELNRSGGGLAERPICRNAGRDATSLSGGIVVTL